MTPWNAPAASTWDLVFQGGRILEVMELGCGELFEFTRGESLRVWRRRVDIGLRVAMRETFPEAED